MAKILDYSFARPGAAKIKSEGFSGVMRYLSPNAGKNLEPSERDELRANDISIGLVWEWYAKRALEGRAAGIEDARAAAAQANALGFPMYLPIYFAVDFDASEAQQGAINAYFIGIREVFSGRKIGAYGGYYIIKRLFDGGLINYGWQTYAWSGGQWDPRAQLRQTLNGQWGGQVDYGNSTVDDWGGWSPTQKPQPATPPAPVATPGGSHDYIIKKGDTFWGIEAANNWTHGMLQNLNPNVVATSLQIGQAIRVPGAAGPEGQSPIQPPEVRATHKIASGDTFWGLEEKNSWPHGTLQGLNPGVNPTTLQIGQSIKVPGGGAPPQPVVHQPAEHVIVKGDTFWQLETNNGWGHGTLQSLNPNVNPTTLRIGSKINIPG